MAYDFNGSQYLQNTSAPVSSAPLTMACWAQVDDTTAAQYLLTVSDSGGSLDAWTLKYRGDVAGDPIAAEASVGGIPAASTSGNTSAGDWFHACGVFASSTSRLVYLNGVAGALSSFTISPSGVNRITIGALRNGTEAVNGRIAEVAVWNAALTEAEVLSLSAGVSPMMVRPSALRFYAPLVRTLVDRARGLTLTNNNSAVVSAHPRIYLPHRRYSRFGSIATSGTVALNGSATTAGQTAPSVLWSKALTGQASTSEQGTVVPDRTRALSGQVVTVEQQSLDDQRGQVFFSQSGSLSGNLTLAISGQAITSATGTITVADTGGDNVTVHLSGQETITAQGQVIVGGQSITGQEITSAHGSVTTSVDLPLTGLVITSDSGVVVSNLAPEDDTFIASASGSPTLSVSVPITGVESSVTQGSVSTQNQEEQLISGAQFIQSEIQTIEPDILFPLTGESITSEQGNFGAPGEKALTGQQIIVEQQSLGLAFQLSGQEIAGQQQAINTVPSNGLFPIFGMQINSATGTLQAVSSSRTEALSGSQLTANTGTLIYGVVENKLASLTGSEITSQTGSITAESLNETILVSLSGQGMTAQQGTLESPSLWVPIDEGTTGWTAKANPNSGWTNIASAYVVTDYVEEGYVRNEGSDSNTSWTRK